MNVYKREQKKYLNSINNVQKRMKRHILLLGGIILAVTLYAVFCTVSMKAEDSQATKTYVENYTEQRADMIHMDIENIQAALLDLAEFIEQGKEEAEIEKYLENKKNLFGLDFIALCDKNREDAVIVGDVPQDGETEEILDRLKTEESFKDRECAVCIQGKNIIYAVNLYENGEKSGVLFGGTGTEEIQEMITVKSFQERGGSYVIDGENHVLLAARSKENPNIWEDINSRTEDKELLKSLKTMMENLGAGKSGGFRVVMPGNKKYFLYYVPTGVSDWVSMTIVPGNLFTGFSDRYVTRMLESLLCTLTVFGVLFFLMFRSYDENERKMKRLVFVDEVTGGINRLEFRMRYQELCRRNEADQYAVALLDVADFKNVNKNFGTHYGDRMLRYFYTVIEDCLRKKEGEFAARTETDHFFLCLHERNSGKIEERLDTIVKKINSFNGTDLPRYNVRFRKGVSFVEGSDTDITVIQDQARAALKNQNKDNKDICVFYDSSVANRLQKEKEMEQMFAASIAEERFLVYMQPKVSLKTGRVEGAEALVRWDYPGIGIISPGEFISVFENNGSIQTLDRYVFERVCIWLSNRKKQNKSLVPVSVNLSRNNFMYDDFLVPYIKLAEKYSVEKSLIEFEVTETVFLDENHTEKAKEGIREIHKYGFKCALDDFGVGYSSLTMLRTFDIDVLKMDRSFFLDLNNKKSRDVISCIVELAEKLNMETVVEGIETEEQINHVKELRCDVVQGYYFSRPLPMEEFDYWMEKFNRESGDVNIMKKENIRKIPGGGV